VETPSGMTSGTIHAIYISRMHAVYTLNDVKRKTNKVDRAINVPMHCMRSERAIAITRVVRRL
jgi:uncharacterized membrane protein